MGRVGGKHSSMGIKIPTVLDLNIVEQGVKIFSVVTLSQQTDTQQDSYITIHRILLVKRDWIQSVTTRNCSYKKGKFLKDQK